MGILLFFSRFRQHSMTKVYMKVMESRSGMIKIIPSQTIKASAYIKTLAKALALISNDTLLISLIKYIRKLVLFTKIDDQMTEFCENDGIAHLFLIMLLINKRQQKNVI